MVGAERLRRKLLLGWGAAPSRQDRPRGAPHHCSVQQQLWSSFASQTNPVRKIRPGAERSRHQLDPNHMIAVEERQQENHEVGVRWRLQHKRLVVPRRCTHQARRRPSASCARRHAATCVGQKRTPHGARGRNAVRWLLVSGARHSQHRVAIAVAPPATCARRRRGSVLRPSPTHLMKAHRADSARGAH